MQPPLISRAGQQNMKQPVLKLRNVQSLGPHTPNYDDLIHDPSEAQLAPNNCGADDSLPGSVYDCGQQQHGSEVNDRRRPKRIACLRLTSCNRHIGNEGYDDELQSDQGAGRRTDDYIKVPPSSECCHGVASIWVMTTVECPAAV